MAIMYKPEHGLADTVPAEQDFQTVYYRGLDKKLHSFSVAEDDAVEARRLVKVELDTTGVKTIGPVLAIVQGGKV